jgi:hypothetical protein
VPFLVALAIVIVAGGLAYLFLREDPGDLVRPDRLSTSGASTVRAVASERSPCDRVVRAQVDLAEDAVFVELVVEGTTDDCMDAVVPLEAHITLPEPIGDRRLRAGVGRYQIPCARADPSGSETQSFRCTPDR